VKKIFDGTRGKQAKAFETVLKQAKLTEYSFNEKFQYMTKNQAGISPKGKIPITFRGEPA